MGEGAGGMIWENGIEIRMISYMERVASPGSMHNTGCLGLVHWDDPEGWKGGKEGEPQEEGNVRILPADSLHCAAETNTLQSNFASIKKNKNKVCPMAQFL